MNKDFDDACAFIEDLVWNHYQRGRKHAHVKKAPWKGGLYKMSVMDHINTTVDSLFQKFDNIDV